MKFLLLTSFEMPRRSRTAQIPPMGSMVLSSCLRANGHTVVQRDLDIEHLHDPVLAAGIAAREGDASNPEFQRYFETPGHDRGMDALLDAMLATVPLGEFDLIGISAKRPFGARLLAKRIKELTGKPIVVGGDLGAAQEDLLRTTPQIDYFISGRGEIPLLRLMEIIESGGDLSVSPGLIYRSGGEVRKALPYQMETTFQSSLPDMAGLRPELYMHQRPFISQLPNPGCRVVLPYYFIEGCPFKCSFCRSSDYGGAREPEQIADHLEQLRDSNNCCDFIFLNNVMNVSEKYAAAVCGEIINRRLNIRWTDSMRPDNWTPALMEKMAEAGCASIVFGVESGSDAVLKRMNRRNTVNSAGRALKSAHGNGIVNRVNFIVGFPGETDGDFSQSLDFVRRNAEYIDGISISEFYLVRSDLTANPGKYGIRIRSAGDADWDGKIAFDEDGGMDWDTRRDVVHGRALSLLDAFHEARDRQRPLGNIYEIFELIRRHKSKSAMLRALRTKKDNSFFLFLGTACNNRCDSCTYANYHQSLKHPTLDDIETEIAAADQSGYDTVVLTGGEPALREDFFEILDLLNKRRFKITVETNGRILYYKDFVKRLAGYGALELVVHGLKDDAAAHDASVGAPGAFLQIAKGIRNCIDEKVRFTNIENHFLYDRIPPFMRPRR